MSEHFQADKHEEYEARYQKACMTNPMVRGYQEGRITAEQAMLLMAEQIDSMIEERVKRYEAYPQSLNTYKITEPIRCKCSE